MNKLIFAAPLLLVACQTVPDTDAVETAVSRAISLEGVAAARCSLGQPTTAEKLAVTSARLLFMSRFGPTMSDGQRERYGSAMIQTNQACDMVSN